MKFVGIDLTSAFAASPRPIDIAVLDDRLNATFFSVAWPRAEAVIGRDPSFLTQILLAQVPVGPSERMVVAIDGPQGLAAVGNTMRACERILRTPGRTPSALPPAEETGAPFQGYIRSSIDLFAGLLRAAPPWSLAGVTGVGNIEACLWEVFPGAEWVVLAKRRLPSKTTPEGQQARRHLFEALQVVFPTQDLPTPDQNDALVGAYLAWCVHNRPSSVELVGVAPRTADGEIREGFILHAGTTLGVNVPVTEPVVATDRNDDHACLLVLTDYGVVHGREPENAWLVPGHNYAVETVLPHAPLRIELVHAATFPGGRGWRVVPTTRKILARLGYLTPQHLTRQNAVTLRVVAILGKPRSIFIPDSLSLPARHHQKRLAGIDQMTSSETLYVGKVEAQDGAERVCINPYASYGGGSGTLWARVGEEAQLTTRRTSGYVRGICKEILPEQKSISFEITKSAYTLGPFKAGETVVLTYKEIERYDTFFRFDLGDFDSVAERLEKNLQYELDNEMEHRFRAELGADAYDYASKLQQALCDARRAYLGLPRNYQKGNVRNWDKAKKRLLRLMQDGYSGSGETG